MISLTVELLHGSVRANDDSARTGSSDGASLEWPPSPARLFSALVAGGGTGDRRWVEGDESELRVLEDASAPIIAASSSTDTEKVALADRFVVPAATPKSLDRVRVVQNYPARLASSLSFGAKARPKSPLISYIWPDVDLSASQYATLQLRCARVPYLGCADSPVSVSVDRAVSQDGRVLWQENELGRSLLSVPYPGFLDNLDAAFDQFLSGAGPSTHLRRQFVSYSDGLTPEIQDPLRFWFKFNRSIPGRMCLRVTEAMFGAVASAYSNVSGAEAPPRGNGP